MMKYLKILTLKLAVIVAILAVYSTETSAQKRNACPNLRSQIEFAVNTIHKDIDYDLSIGQQQLARLANRSRSSRLKANERPLGLTTSAHSVAYQMSSQVSRINSSRYCARIRSVDVEILVRTLKVYILSKYPRGSCQYKAVLDHENEHVATFQNGISRLENAFNTRLFSLIRNLRPGFGSSPKQASQAAFTNLKNTLERLKSPIERSMILRNRQIDTPLSYHRLVQQCSNW